MPRPLDELQTVLALLIDEHRKLLAEAEKHQMAIRMVNVAQMDAARIRQETLRQTISQLEARRRALTDQIVPGHRGPPLTLTRLAEMNPRERVQLLRQRDELRALIAQIKQHTQTAGRVAGAVLGHLNSVVRVLVGAVQQAGVYTKKGVPKFTSRIGGLEAMG